MTDIDKLRLIIQDKINKKTKPFGALGRLEEVALQAGLIQQTERPQVQNPHIVVFAGDHGIAKTRLVNAYPQEVTAQMVLNFLKGGAAINVFCRQHNIELYIVDAGVNTDWDLSFTDNNFIKAKVGYGTRNYQHEPAMSKAEVTQAIEKGKEIVERISMLGCNCIGFGEMGISNTSSAALIMSAVTGLPLKECTGRGAGVTDEQLQIKVSTLQLVYDMHQLSLPTHPVNLLTKVGGYEIAMMVGACLKAADNKMIIVVDGFIAGAALLVATAIYPNVRDYCIFAHASHEQGHEKMLRHLNAKPLLNLDMRLGEGTGAALAIPLIQSAVNFLNEMASFDSAGISNKDF
jgi:nicotinate-nucleotide--dimethylbenzimidazole phosphoribosyltransferase